MLEKCAVTSRCDSRREQKHLPCQDHTAASTFSLRRVPETRWKRRPVRFHGRVLTAPPGPRCLSPGGGTAGPRAGRGAGRGAGAPHPGERGCHQWEGWPGARFHRAAPRQPAASQCPRGGDERPAGPRPGAAGLGMRTLLSAATAQGRAPAATGTRRAPGRAGESGPGREAGHRFLLQRPQRCLTPPAPGSRSRAGAVCRVSCTKSRPRSPLPPAPGRGAPRLCPHRGVPTAARPARPPAAAAGSAAPPGGLPPHPPAPGGYF